MKYIRKLGLVASLVLSVFAHAAIAQSKEITSTEISKMEQSAISMLRAGPYRSIWTSWVFPERGKEHSYKTTMTTEVDVAGNTRSIQEDGTPGSFRRMEVISVEGQHYRKIDEGPWQRLSPPPSGYGQSVESQPLTGSRPRFELTARLIETQDTKEGLVSIYETVSKSTREENGKDVVRISTSRFWFRYDGMLLRKDMEAETVGESRIVRNSTVYEFTNIPRIEAPNINQ